MRQSSVRCLTATLVLNVHLFISMKQTLIPLHGQKQSRHLNKMFSSKPVEVTVLGGSHSSPAPSATCVEKHVCAEPAIALWKKGELRPAEGAHTRGWRGVLGFQAAELGTCTAPLRRAWLRDSGPSAQQLHRELLPQGPLFYSLETSEELTPRSFWLLRPRLCN